MSSFGTLLLISLPHPALTCGANECRRFATQIPVAHEPESSCTRRAAPSALLRAGLGGCPHIKISSCQLFLGAAEQRFQGSDYEAG